MSQTMYDAQNSYLTLGFEMIEANRNLREIIAQENTIDKVQRLEAMVLYMDQRMAPYRAFMRLDYFDEEQKKMVSIDDYENAMRYLVERRDRCRVYLEDRLERPKYLYWVLQWSGLISSAYSKLKMVPEMTFGVDNTLMEKMGVDRAVIDPVVAEGSEKEEEVPVEQLNPYDSDIEEDDDDYELEPTKN